MWIILLAFIIFEIILESANSLADFTWILVFPRCSWHQSWGRTEFESWISCHYEDANFSITLAIHAHVNRGRSALLGLGYWVMNTEIYIKRFTNQVLYEVWHSRDAGDLDVFVFLQLKLKSFKLLIRSVYGVHLFVCFLLNKPVLPINCPLRRINKTIELQLKC